MDQRSEIKGRLSIVDLVSQYVELKKAGTNFKGLCPFHDEKSPSFIVSPDKEIAYCFGCNKGGDIFKFYQEVEGVGFRDALKDLGAKVGIEIVQVDQKIVEQKKSVRMRMYEMHGLACEFFQQNLSVKIKKYLSERGVDDKLIELYKIGFAPNSYDALHLMLLSEGFSKEEIVEGGLASSKDTAGGGIFDRFRNRLVFPIISADDKVVGFGGRAMGDDPAKYLNSPDTPIYHKSNELFGFNLAKDAIRKSGEVVLVEGYFDQLACWREDVKNCVAISGTSLSNFQLTKLKKICDNLIFCLDSDEAGVNAMYRSAELALDFGFNLAVYDLKGEKDPSDFFAKYGKSEIEKLDFFDFLIKYNYLMKDEEFRSSNDGVVQFLNLVIPFLRKIGSYVVKDIVVRKVATTLSVSVEVVYRELKRDLKKQVVPMLKKTDKSVMNVKQNWTLEEHFWAYLYLCPQVFGELVEECEKYEFVWIEKNVYKTFIDYYNEHRELKCENERIRLLALYLETHVILDWDDDECVVRELKILLKRICQEYKREQGRLIEEKIRSLSKNGLEDNSKELQNLLLEHKKILSI